eukprot:843509-Lingulodinium_polyedra.AAC.1
MVEAWEHIQLAVQGQWEAVLVTLGLIVGDWALVPLVTTPAAADDSLSDVGDDGFAGWELSDDE